MAKLISKNMEEKLEKELNDITNLKFYSDRGIELPMQKSYILTWRIIPGKMAEQYI